MNKALVNAFNLLYLQLSDLIHDKLLILLNWMFGLNKIYFADFGAILAGANSNAYLFDYLIWTPLHLAASKCHKDVVKILLAHGSNVNEIRIAEKIMGYRRAIK